MSEGLVTHYITAWVCHACGHRGLVESKEQSAMEAAVMLCDHRSSGCAEPKMHGESMRIQLPTENWKEARRIFKEHHR